MSWGGKKKSDNTSNLQPANDVPPPFLFKSLSNSLFLLFRLHTKGPEHCKENRGLQKRRGSEEKASGVKLMNRQSIYYE